MKAEYFPPKIDVILQNEIPTDIYILVSGAVEVFTYKGGTEQYLSKSGAGDMAGEIGVLLNIPQPFTVRTKRLSQIIRISHHQFKEIVLSQKEDGKIMISNFIQYLKGLNKDMQQEIPFLSELLDDLGTEHRAETEEDQNNQKLDHATKNINGYPQTTTPLSRTFPMRLIIHGYDPTEDTMEGNKRGKLVHLPDSIEDLLGLAEKKFGRAGNKILMADGAQVEDLNALRENDPHCKLSGTNIP
ncbi:cyclic nucleotide-binding domain-containing protein [Proteus mirabilis]|nr:cyclic nucleotide-binding domain-containing protein [Proteus mirabilis]